MTLVPMNRFPAILIGGPPHTGKSVLAKNLKGKLRDNKYRFHHLSATPDGEGDWFHDADPEVSRTLRQKGQFTESFVEQICRDIATRPLPFLIDVGGKPEPWQEKIFDQCTHAILLIKDEASTKQWQALMSKWQVIIIALIQSEQSGESVLEVTKPVLRGTITQLERHQSASGPVFEALFHRVRALFTYEEAELFNIHQEQSPVELVVDIARMGQQLHPHRTNWLPQDLPAVLDYLPDDNPLALYGSGPVWLYGAVAAYTTPQPFYQFDARRGWLQPVVFVSPSDASIASLSLKPIETDSYLQLEFDITTPDGYLNYKPLPLNLPDIPVGRGVVLHGRGPIWLFTSLVRHYQQAAWIAIYYPQEDVNVVVTSRTPQLTVGDTIAVGGNQKTPSTNC